jgi:hypothetical protein
LGGGLIIRGGIEIDIYTILQFEVYPALSFGFSCGQGQRGRPGNEARWHEGSLKILAKPHFQALI